jgi:hypothetical protein
VVPTPMRTILNGIFEMFQLSDRFAGLQLFARLPHDEPEEGVSIKEELHSVYSSKSSKGSSKSSDITINPLALPNCG